MAKSLLLLRMPNGIQGFTYPQLPKILEQATVNPELVPTDMRRSGITDPAIDEVIGES